MSLHKLSWNLGWYRTYYMNYDNHLIYTKHQKVESLPTHHRHVICWWNAIVSTLHYDTTCLIFCKLKPPLWVSHYLSYNQTKTCVTWYAQSKYCESYSCNIVIWHVSTSKDHDTSNHSEAWMKIIVNIVDACLNHQAINLITSL